MSNVETRRGHAAMLAFSALVAGSFSLGALAVPHMEPSVINLVRFSIAFGIAVALATAQGKLSRRTYEAPWRYLILGGLYAIYFMAMFEALKIASAISTSAVFTLTPLMAALVGLLFLGERISRRMGTALVIGALGAIWVIFRADLQALLRFDIGKGELIFLGGCLAHAIFPSMTRRLNRGESPIATNTGMLAAMVVMIGIYGWDELLATEWSEMPPIVWVTIVYTSIFSGVTTFSLMQYASLRLPAGKVMAYTYLTPAWVVAWELALGRPGAPVAVLAGVGLICVALLLLLRNEHETKENPATIPPGP